MLQYGLKWVSKFSITQHNEGLSERSDFSGLTQLQTSLLSYKQSSQKQAEQTQKAKCACMCVYAPVCMRVLACRCVFVCSRKSGVWILSSCLSDRKASSVKQRGPAASVSAMPHFCSSALNTEVHIGLCTLGLYALTQCPLVSTPPT